ncbi:MAG: TIGR00730 family Rossman fold protein [Acidobacteria bacterium]|nr:TIGR00730 family Rossman fold protein [Acidobacteriota bacterium]
MLTSVSVQCGSALPGTTALRGVVIEVGKLLARSGIHVIFGGVKTGLMGLLATSVLEHGGQITGVIPRFLVDDGIACESLTSLRIVETMDERKKLMLTLADAVVVLPGGVGTQDEFWDTLTGAQLGLHSKPCGLLNVSGYYDSLLAFIDGALAEGLLSPSDRDNVIVSSDPESLLTNLSTVVAERNRFYHGEESS